jgi:hypothetical protein
LAAKRTTDLLLPKDKLGIKDLFPDPPNVLLARREIGHGVVEVPRQNGCTQDWVFLA